MRGFMDLMKNIISQLFRLRVQLNRKIEIFIQKLDNPSGIEN